MAVPLNAFLIVGALIFSIGVFGVLIRRNILIVFISIELMLQGVNLTLGAFSTFLEDMGGNVLVLMSLTVAAAEAAVGLAILVALSRTWKVFNVDRFNRLRW